MREGVNINTAQNVSLNFQIASLGDRIVSGLIDLLVRIALVIVTAIMIGITGGENDTVNIIIGCLFGIPNLFYHLLFELFMDGQSPGKKALKLQVASMDGSEVSFGQYLLRFFLRLIDMMFYWVVSIVTIAVNGKGQRLGDLAANTTVISLKQKASLNQTIYEKVVEEYEPVYLESMNLSTRDAAIIKDVIIAYVKGADESLVLETADRVSGMLKVSYQGHPNKFLRTVLKDYNHFEKNLT